jgi:hypothetical protein
LYLPLAGQSGRPQEAARLRNETLVRNHAPNRQILVGIARRVEYPSVGAAIDPRPYGGVREKPAGGMLVRSEYLLAVSMSMPKGAKNRGKVCAPLNLH